MEETFLNTCFEFPLLCTVTVEFERWMLTVTLMSGFRSSTSWYRLLLATSLRKLNTNNNTNNNVMTWCHWPEIKVSHSGGQMFDRVCVLVSDKCTSATSKLLGLVVVVACRSWGPQRLKWWSGGSCFKIMKTLKRFSNYHFHICECSNILDIFFASITHGFDS